MVFSDTGRLARRTIRHQKTPLHLPPLLSDLLLCNVDLYHALLDCFFLDSCQFYCFLDCFFLGWIRTPGQAAACGQDAGDGD